MSAQERCHADMTLKELALHFLEGGCTSCILCRTSADTTKGNRTAARLAEFISQFVKFPEFDDQGSPHTCYALFKSIVLGKYSIEQADAWGSTFIKALKVLAVEGENGQSFEFAEEKSSGFSIVGVGEQGDDDAVRKDFLLQMRLKAKPWNQDSQRTGIEEMPEVKKVRPKPPLDLGNETPTDREWVQYGVILNNDPPKPVLAEPMVYAPSVPFDPLDRARRRKKAIPKQLAPSSNVQNVSGNGAAISVSTLIWEVLPSLERVKGILTASGVTTVGSALELGHKCLRACGINGSTVAALRKRIKEALPDLDVSNLERTGAVLVSSFNNAGSEVACVVGNDLNLSELIEDEMLLSRLAENKIRTLSALLKLGFNQLWAEFGKEEAFSVARLLRKRNINFT